MVEGGEGAGGGGLGLRAQGLELRARARAQAELKVTRRLRVWQNSKMHETRCSACTMDLSGLRLWSWPD